MSEFVLTRWLSHKIVGAAPIVSMRAIELPFAESGWEVVVDDWASKARVTVRVPGDTFARGMPQPGDYLVEYRDQPDGAPYWSWSPKAVFERGHYTFTVGE